MPIYGPTTGIPLAKPAIVPKKSPNRITIPYASTKKPINVQRIKIIVRPAKKAAVPLAFCLRAKKRSVFWGPMMIFRPMRKRIYTLYQLLLDFFPFFEKESKSPASFGGARGVSYISHGKPVCRLDTIVRV